MRARACGRGECDVALAGGVNVMVAPDAFVALSQGAACWPGTVAARRSIGGRRMARGEGCGVLVLKRLCGCARATATAILAVIRGSAVNQDGRSEGLDGRRTAPRRRR